MENISFSRFFPLARPLLWLDRFRTELYSMLDALGVIHPHHAVARIWHWHSQKWFCESAEVGKAILLLFSGLLEGPLAPACRNARPRRASGNAKTRKGSRGMCE